MLSSRSKMFFKQVRVGVMQNFSYIIGSKGEAAIVDPGWDVNKLVSICDDEGLKITKVLLTHGHFDHAQKLGKIVKKAGATVYVHELENINYNDMKIENVSDNDEIKLGKLKIKVIHTPGHTPGSVCFLVSNKLITGDTLFVEAVGRVDLPGSDPQAMKESLKKLSELDENIEVYPGHDYGSKPSSTIKYEKENNPYMDS